MINEPFDIQNAIQSDAESFCATPYSRSYMGRNGEMVLFVPPFDEINFLNSIAQLVSRTQANRPASLQQLAADVYKIVDTFLYPPSIVSIWDNRQQRVASFSNPSLPEGTLSCGIDDWGFTQPNSLGYWLANENKDHLALAFPDTIYNVCINEFFAFPTNIRSIYTQTDPDEIRASRELLVKRFDSFENISDWGLIRLGSEGLDLVKDYPLSASAVLSPLVLNGDLLGGLLITFPLYFFFVEEMNDLVPEERILDIQSLSEQIACALNKLN